MLRSSDPRYLHYVDRWWDELLPRFAGYMYDKGGPVVMVQVGGGGALVVQVGGGGALPAPAAVLSWLHTHCCA